MSAKRWLICAMIGVLLLPLLLPAYAKPATLTTPVPSPTPTPSPKPTPTPWPKEIAIVGGPVGGTSYVIAIAASALISKYIPEVKATATPSSGPTENIRLLTGKKAEMGFGVDSVAFWAIHGQMMFAQTGPILPAQRMLMSSEITGRLQIFTLADSGIKSVPDLKGKKLAGKQTGQIAIDVVRQTLFKTYGMTDNDVKLLTYGSLDDGTRMVKEGVADALLTITGTPGPAITDIASVKSVRFIPLDMDKAQAAEKALVVYFPAYIKAGIYPGLDKDILTLGTGTHMLIRPDIDESLAYAILKAIYDHESELLAFHPDLRDWTLKTALRAWLIPYHPGSVKFYKEKGMWTKEMDEKQQALLKQFGG